MLFDQRDGAEGNGIVAELGHGDNIVFATSGERVQTDDLLDDGEDEIATGLDDTAAQDDEVWIQEVADVEAGIAEGFGGLAHDFGDEFVFLLEGAFEDIAFNDSEVVAGEFGDGGFAAVFDGVAEIAFDSGAAGEGFEAAAVATAAEGAPGLHDHVADFAGGVAAAGDELAVDDHTGADTGADEDTDGGGSAAGGAAPGLAERAEVNVVAEINGHFEAFAQERGDDDAGERHVRGEDDFAFGRGDRAGDGEADAGEIAGIEIAFGEENSDNIADGGDDMSGFGVAGSGHAFAGDDGAFGVGEGGHDFGATDVNTEVELAGRLAHNNPYGCVGEIIANMREIGIIRGMKDRTTQNSEGPATGRARKVMTTLQHAVAGTMGFFTYGIWRVRMKEYPRYKSWLIAMARALVLSVRGFQKDKCQYRASALTYYTLLSIVPILAMAFGIAKGFGLEERLRSSLQKFEAQREVIERAVEFAQNLLNQTSGGLIAGVGVLFLLWAVIKLLSNVEHSLNDIWGVKQPRTMTRKFTDYISVMFLCPVLLIVSSSLNVMLNDKVDFLTSRIAAVGPLAPYIKSALSLTRYVVTWLVFSFVYLFLPNTKVKMSAGLIGGVIAGTIFIMVQWVYVVFQVGVANYNRIYGGFAALPLFLMWLNTSWVVMLYGAELAFACHNVSTYEYEPDSINVSHGIKKLLALRIVHVLAKRFVRGEKAMTAMEIAEELELPVRLVRQLVYELRECGILAEVVIAGRETRGYQPARDVRGLTVMAVIDALEQHGYDEIPLGQSKELQILAKTLDEFGALLSAAPANKPLVELVDAAVQA